MAPDRPDDPDAPMAPAPEVGRLGMPKRSRSKAGRGRSQGRDEASDDGRTGRGWRVARRVHQVLTVVFVVALPLTVLAGLATALHAVAERFLGPDNGLRKNGLLSRPELPTVAAGALATVVVTALVLAVLDHLLHRRLD